MRCTRATLQLQLYIDHQLTFEQIRLLEAHLSVCPACRNELMLLEETAYRLDTLKVVYEPITMHAQIMQKVALKAAARVQIQSVEKQTLRFFFRPSLTEILTASILATIATLAILLQQPWLRTALPLTNDHNAFSNIYMQAVRMLTGIDTNTLILALWIVGTLLGVCITLAVAGNEMRTQWFKAMLERLPVR